MDRRTRRIFIGCPLHDGRLDAGTAKSLLHSATQSEAPIAAMNISSLLANNCNNLWCAALEARKSHNITWFAMLHGDIEPDFWWADRLIDEAEACGADIMSVVVPIKDTRGLTSTAISSLEDPSPFCRITQRQLNHADFPQTFDFAGLSSALRTLPDELGVPDAPEAGFLLVNTGCAVFRITEPWAEKVWFEIRDRIVPNAAGGFDAEVIPEDWNLSRMAALQGAKVMATRKVKVVHKGGADYISTTSWGMKVDTDCRK